MSHSHSAAIRRFILLSLLAAGAQIHGTASAQDVQRDLVNQGIVGIIAGDADGTNLDAVADLAHALNDGYELRILPIIGDGSVRNVEDLLFLRGIDLAVVQADVLDFYRRNELIPNVDQRVRYVARLFDEEVHLLARSEIGSIDDLEGKRVNFGLEGDGTFLTSGIIFDALSIDVEVTSDPHNVALEKLKAGELDAMVLVAGKPAALLQSIDRLDGIRLLSLPAGRISGAYEPAAITYDDYPDLMVPGRSIETVSVAAVLAAYNWPDGHPRAEKVERFVASLFDGGLDRLLEPPFHPKWRDVDLFADVPDWQRLETVERLLASR